jgi:enoyl-CoA hydratase
VSGVEIRRDGDVVRATLANPGRGNAMSPEMVEQLRDVLDALAADEQAIALVLTGSGRSFCGGADVTASAALGDAGLRLDFINSGRQLVDALGNSPVPVVAAVNGAAFAGGLELVLGCDVVVAADSAVFGDLHLTHGRIPGWGGATRLIQRCGWIRATELLLLGRRWDAATARTNGLVTDVVPADDLDAAVDGVLESLRSADPKVLRQMVAVTRQIRRRPPEEAAAVEWQHFVRHFGVSDPGVVDLHGTD